MVAGGGASVIYADTVADLGGASEMANYGEYSGAPTEGQTYEYAATILKLMTKEAHPLGKILLIGGGIANFTNVAETFKGIIKVIKKFEAVIRSHNIKIFVRRGGPNFQEGLDRMRDLASSLDLPIEVYGPEVHMTSIVSLALGKPLKSYEPRHLPKPPAAGRTRVGLKPSGSGNSLSATPETKDVVATKEVKTSAKDSVTSPTTGSSTTGGSATSGTPSASPTPAPILPTQPTQWEAEGGFQLFTPRTRALVFGLQLGAAQNMLDFDFICGRQKGSVAGLVYPFNASHLQKFYWNTQEVLLPIYQQLDEAISKNADVDVVVNFSSFRSVYETTVDIMKHPQIKTIAIIAEGVPERQTRSLIRIAKSKGISIIGPATVGGIKPGCFRVGNTGGMLDNIISSKLYRPGSIAYVARSGGMSNEMNNIISRNSDGVYEGVAIGGDRYPGTTFMDHLKRYQANPDVKIMVVLGEVGGIEEYDICEAVRARQLTKPIIAWCIGTCAKMFSYEVQFGHAGACAHGDNETASAKNAALKAVGCFVPDSFEDFGLAINTVYSKLVEDSTIHVRDEPAVPSIPVDYDWARKLGNHSHHSQHSTFSHQSINTYHYVLWI
jgi:ATP citrate (pro-S)-lyase